MHGDPTCIILVHEQAIVGRNFINKKKCLVTFILVLLWCSLFLPLFSIYKMENVLFRITNWWLILRVIVNASSRSTYLKHFLAVHDYTFTALINMTFSWNIQLNANSMPVKSIDSHLTEISELFCVASQSYNTDRMKSFEKNNALLYNSESSNLILCY